MVISSALCEANVTIDLAYKITGHDSKGVVAYGLTVGMLFVEVRRVRCRLPNRTGTVYLTEVSR